MRGHCESRRQPNHDVPRWLDFPPNSLYFVRAADGVGSSTKEMGTRAYFIIWGLGIHASGSTFTIEKLHAPGSEL